ncbi:MAG: fasciclin domain-containing protein, partial [Actinomycetota bacterium]|nr:fasciclin domain-containing protein [Actinomycetota bacterium]
TILSYHVVPKRYDAAGLVQAGTLTELAGGQVTIGGTPTAPTVTDGKGNTANVLCGNIPTSNATVFVIDKVLMPAG